jgi:hypothetical protein
VIKKLMRKPKVRGGEVPLEKNEETLIEGSYFKAGENRKEKIEQLKKNEDAFSSNFEN